MARTQNFNRIKITTSDSQENHIILQEVSGQLYIDDNLVLTSAGTQEGTRSLFITDLPTEDPGSVGQIWNESGVLKVSENQTLTLSIDTALNISSADATSVGQIYLGSDTSEIYISDGTSWRKYPSS